MGTGRFDFLSRDEAIDMLNRAEAGADMLIEQLKKSEERIAELEKALQDESDTRLRWERRMRRLEERLDKALYSLMGRDD